MIYKEFVTSKNGDKIPLFENSTPMHSKYNPQREAENFANQLITEQLTSAFFVIGGIGGGFHIQELANKLTQLNTEFFILAFEDSKEEIDFLMESQLIKELSKNPKICFCKSSDLCSKLKENYLPVFYEKFIFTCNTAWENFHKSFDSTLPNTQLQIKQTLDSISADYSVMCHFGKLWQKNIFKNLKQVKKSTAVNELINCPILQNLSEKTAAIIAAGPSLDNSINELKSNRNNFIIISSDTAFPVLIKNNIHPDFVLTIDAQDISKTHYYVNSPELTQNTYFILELSSAPSIAQKVNTFTNAKIIYTINNHPLEQFALQNFNVPQIFSGAGTVTVSAIDFANQLGFNKIKLFGADFCYNNSKPYCKGTYLDSNLVINSNRFNTCEFLFSKLMFRNQLISADFSKYNLSGQKLINPQTSTVMENYKQSVIDYAQNNNFELTNNLLTKKSNQQKIFDQSKNPLQSFDYETFLENYQKESENQKSPVNLPYKAYLCYNKSL